MPHDLSIEQKGLSTHLRPGVLTLMVAGLLALIVLLVADVRPDEAATQTEAVSSAEDWHGNVKRSHWTPR